MTAEVFIIRAAAEANHDYFGKVVVTFRVLGSADRYANVPNTQYSQSTLQIS